MRERTEVKICGLRRRADVLAADGHGGGRSYDALIAATARAGGAAALLTFNERDFASFGRDAWRTAGAMAVVRPPPVDQTGV